MKKKTKKKEPIDKLYDAVERFLKASKWKPIVIGGVKIEQPMFSQRFNYNLVIGFTGASPTDAKQNPA